MNRLEKKKLLKLTEQQKYWLDAMQMAYSEFVKAGGDLVHSAEISRCYGEVFAINRTHLGFDENNYENILEYASAFTDTNMNIIEYLDEMPFTFKED